MNTLDIVLLATAIIGFIIGFKAGLIKQLTLGAGIAIGLLLAVLYHSNAATRIAEMTRWDGWICSVAGFTAILVVSIVALSIIGMVIKWLLSLIFLGILDRILGGLLTSAFATIAITFTINVSTGILPNNSITGETSQMESVLYNKVSKITFSVIEEIKKDR